MTARKKPQFTLHLLGLAVVGIVVFMIQMGNTHLWDQDEGYYATAAAEMYARGDWVTPTFNGELFGHKPPMMFWGMMVGYHLFGVNELGARFASSLFGIGTILLTYAIARKLFDAATGLFAGLAIGSCILFSVVARSATADAHLTFFTVLALFLWISDYFQSEEIERDQRLRNVRWLTWFATYAAMGLAALTKGPIGFLFPTAVIGLFLLTEQTVTTLANGTRLQCLWLRWKNYSPTAFVATVWKMRPLTAAATLLAIASPWYALVQWRTDGAFLREFIGVHHMGRFSTAMDNHSGPVYYYFIACLVGLYPWSAFAIPTAMAWFSESQQNIRARSVRFVTCWVTVYLVIFSLASTKLPNYVLPAYPALAIVIGRYFAMWTSDMSSVSVLWLKRGWGLMIAIGLVLLLAFPIAGLIEFGGSTLMDRVAIARSVQLRFVGFGVAGLPLVFFGAIGLLLVGGQRPKMAAGSFACAAISLMLILAQYVAPELDRFQTPQLLAQKWKSQVSPDDKVAILGYFRPTMVFYFGRDVEFVPTGNEAVELARSAEPMIMITTQKQYESIQSELPATTRILERMSQFPSREEVFVLGNGSLKR